MDQKTLKSLFHYCPDSGKFTRLSGRKKVGNVNTSGHLQIQIGDSTFLASRLAYLYMVGEWPANQMDHIDLNRTNDRWENLRPATPSENARNRSVRSDSLTGIKGVTAMGDRFQARVSFEGRRYSAGYFDTLEEAAAAVKELRAQLHGEFTRHQ